MEVLVRGVNFDCHRGGPMQGPCSHMPHGFMAHGFVVTSGAAILSIDKTKL
jgi:hypothetical protein